MASIPRRIDGLVLTATTDPDSPPTKSDPLATIRASPIWPKVASFDPERWLRSLIPSRTGLEPRLASIRRHDRIEARRELPCQGLASFDHARSAHGRGFPLGLD